MATRSVVGLDIGTSAVRAAELALGRGPAELRRFGAVPLPPGAVRNGEVADPETVAAALRQLWSTAKFSSKRVGVGVANQRVIVRQVDLPWLPMDELRASLPFQVQDFVPIPVEEAILDFHPVEEITDDSGDRLVRVLLVAAAREMVSGMLAAVSKAGLTAVNVDLTPFALLRSLTTHDPLGLGSAEAIVDVGASVTNIVVHEGGVPRFVRMLLMGGDDITHAVAERMGVPWEEAEGLKRDSGVPPVPSVVPEQTHPGLRALEGAVQALVDEVRGSLDYYLAQPTSVRIGTCVVSGGGAQLAGFRERLSAGLRLPLQGPGLAERLARAPRGLTAESVVAAEPQLSVPVGLALGLAS